MNMKPRLSPHERRQMYNRTKLIALPSYAACETFFKTLKYRDKLWIGDDPLYLGKQGFHVVGIEEIVIPPEHEAVIAAIGPVATRITLDFLDNEPGFYKDVISYNVYDAMLYVSRKKPH